ncbi:ACB domain-containing protein [Heracleum sosnowskyi]|uniref:ACB domain-containing protein n=1 Tax=Heracleum sosnowskyi TaxID=360622 RepID=A0AAD8N9J5_9APIA|nr:ACB domain-containing protein [Heracleum sosnowskyi]
MAGASSGLAYPERFFAAASYAGFDGSPNSSSSVTSKFSNDVALLLYGLYQQATLGPCKIPKPRSWSPVEQNKWTSWNGLDNMASTEAMRLFVKILEEEDPGWYSRASNFVPEPVQDIEMNSNSKVESVIENGNALPETKIIPAENGNVLEAQDKDVVMVGLGSVGLYDQWVAPLVSGPRPKARYEHGAAVIDDKMYIYGGNHNGRYLNDVQVLDLRNWTWSRAEVKAPPVALEPSSVIASSCAGHSLIPWGKDKLLSIAGHTKDPSESMQVKVFDLQTFSWSALKTYGKPPVSRGGQSATLVGTSVVIFGGQDAKRSLLNDLHILDLETLTWDEIETLGVPPSPRSDHAAAVHAERYLLIFGGGSHATCFNDLHVLDLQTMEWSRPTQQGEVPSPRAGHAGATVGESWFIAGGGDNKSGAPETVVLNMSTLAWSVVTTVQGRVPLASEGLSLVLSSYSGEDVLVSFGGYNGRYSNEVNVLKPSHKSSLQSKLDTPVPDSVSGVHNATNATRDVESDNEASQEGKIREIVMDKVDSEPKIKNFEQTSEQMLAALKIEKADLESSLSKEKLQSIQLKHQVEEAENRNTDLYKELQSVRGQLASEQSRCFKLEVDVAELRQKLQNMETLQKELELLQRQKAASEQAALSAKQSQGSGGVWGWLAGSPGPKADDA